MITVPANAAVEFDYGENETFNWKEKKKKRKVFIIQLVESSSGKIFAQEICSTRVIVEGVIRIYECYVRFGYVIRTCSREVDDYA